LLKSFKHFVVIYTDYKTSLNIIKQFIFIITYINKLNLKHVNVSEYLQRFSLDIRYKFGIFYYVFNAFSRLTTIILAILRLNIIKGKLDVFFIIYAYLVILVEMFSKFRKKIINKYIINKF